MDWTAQSWEIAAAVATWGAGVLLGLVMLAGIVIAAWVAILAAVAVATAMHAAVRSAVWRLKNVAAQRIRRRQSVMSNTMLLGILRAPVSTDDYVSLHQLIRAARQAADRIEADAERIAELERSCDRAYIAGLKEGFGLGQADDNDGLSSLIKSRRRDLRRGNEGADR